MRSKHQRGLSHPRVGLTDTLGNPMSQPLLGNAPAKGILTITPKELIRLAKVFGAVFMNAHKFRAKEAAVAAHN